MKLFIATGNKDKLIEIKDKLNSKIEIYSPIDFGIENFEVIEDAETLEGNALLKAEAYFKKVNIPVISDDTGLFVDELNGNPGIYSARYAGENASYRDNCNRLLTEMNDKTNRKAEFRTVICFKNSEQVNYFIGVCEGEINKKIRGVNGFGYDPIFIPNGYNKTFAELDKSVKNSISHRAKAVEKFVNFINLNIN